MLPNDVLVQVWNAVVSHGHAGQERQRPRVPRPEDDVVHVGDDLAVCEVDGTARDVAD